MASTHQIVIIGASFAGLAVASGLLKDVLPKLTAGGKQSFKVIQIAPNEDFLFKIALPRALVKPNEIATEKVLVPIAPAYKKYGDQYEFVKAMVKSVDHATKTLTLNTGATVKYDSLVITSGTSMTDYWTAADGIDPFMTAFKSLQERIPKAESILIAGGGPVGIETAGELAELYGKKKEITLLSGSKTLMASLKSATTGNNAQQRLEQMGVKVLHDVKVVSDTREGDKDVLQLSNGETKTVDLYISAIGDKPNTDYLPTEWLNERKKVKNDPHTLRLDVPGVTGVYVFGSAGSYSNGTIFDIKMASGAMMETLRNDLSGQEPGPRTKKIYNKIQSDTILIPIGSTGGVGAAFGWQLPSFLIRFVKSKDFMIGQAPSSLA